MRQCALGHPRRLPYPHLIREMCRQAGAEIDLDKSGCPLKGVLNDIIFEQLHNKHLIRVRGRNEQVVQHREYTQDHGLPKPIKKPQLVQPWVHRTKGIPSDLTKKGDTHVHCSTPYPYPTPRWNTRRYLT